MEHLNDFSGLAIFLLAICILCVCVFEFINGFHDTANAVATVIYTKSMKPLQAVIYSGILNFLGMASSLYIIGPKVAMGMVKLMPVNDMMSQPIGVGIALIFAILLSAIFWNFFTWYFGIPCSSSHTMIGALIGGGIGFQYFYGGKGPNWDKAMDIGKSLLLSPLFGFAVVIILMIFLRMLIKNKVLFSEPEEHSKPPVWIRIMLFITCGLVSFFHGQNDGQKGLGLLLVVLMTFLPVHYALNPHMDIAKTTQQVDTLIGNYTLAAAKSNNAEIIKSLETATKLKEKLASFDNKNKDQIFGVRKDIGSLQKSIENIEKDDEANVDKETIKLISTNLKPLKKNTEHAPLWAVLLISACLGLGTTIGWKRIVVTIGEKIGKSHLTYAQGATSELVAATTIGLSSYYGLPVSTTHVLSSGIAGSMVAARGVKNLQKSTITNIILAWVLTLPVTIVLAALLFFIFNLFN